jgi:hypothetical protein
MENRVLRGLKKETENVDIVPNMPIGRVAGCYGLNTIPIRE